MASVFGNTRLLHLMWPLALSSAALAAELPAVQGSAAPSGSVSAPTEEASMDAGSGVEEIVVTARRREESAQKTPVALTVLSDQQLREQGITQISNLTAAVPGVNFSRSASSGNTIFSIRGMSRGVIGNAQPAVATYVDEVPLITWGNNIPTYDTASVQVLKGPQGTLFGRNTTAGAVLITTKQPSHHFEAQAETTVGSYSWRQMDATVNVPIVQDKVALRVSGQYADRDGYTKNMSDPDRDLDDLHRRGFRASLLVEPVEGLKNVTIFDWVDYDENGPGNPVYQYTPGGTVDLPALVWINGGVPPFTGVPASDVRAAVARQDAAGERKMWTDVPLSTERRLSSWINTTTYDFGGVTLKNIYGHRRVRDLNFADVDGYEAPLIGAVQQIGIAQDTDELQLSGTSFDDKLDWIVGTFYLKQKPSGSSRLAIQSFAMPGTPIDTPSAQLPFNGAIGNSDYYYDRSIAGYGQVSYDLSGVNSALDGFKVDLGVRYTKDKERACSVSGQLQSNPPATPSDCEDVGTSARTNSKKLTYTFGLDYQANDQLLLYGVTRRGYRAGGVNPPQLGGTLTAFQTYEPEEVTDVELGFKYDWSAGDWGGRFNVAAYRSKYKDLIASITTASAEPVSGPDGDGDPSNNPSNAVFYSNVGKATIQGIEVEATANLSDSFQLSLGGAVIDKEIDQLAVALPATLGLVYTKKDAAAWAFNAAPKYSANANARYRLPLDPQFGEVALGASAFRIGEVTYGGVVAQPWTKVDFRVDWNGLWQSPLDASVFVSNAFDKTAIIGGALNSIGLGVSSAIYNEPRMVGVQLRYSFGE